MKDYAWQQSPEWLRREELLGALETAEKAMDEAGKWVLACLRVGHLDGPSGRRDREAYLAANEAYEDAYEEWREACKAFDASPAGQARARWRALRAADPIARTSTPAPEEIAA